MKKQTQGTASPIGDRARNRLFHAICIGLLLAGTAQQVHAQDKSQADQMTQLQREITELQRTLADLATRQDKRDREQATAASPAATAPSTGFKVGNTTVKLGGVVKVDLVENFNQDLGHKTVPLLIDPTIASTAHKGAHFNASARGTTLTLDTMTPTSWGPVSAHVETDFNDSAGGNEQATNSYGLRLRRAFFTTPNWLFGQEWTTFSDFNLGKILDYVAPVGTIFVRQPQIRYTHPLAKGAFLDVAIENPDGAIRGASGNISDSNNGFDLQCPTVASRDCGAQNSLPDLAARYRYASGPMNFQVAAIARRIKLNGTPGNKTTAGWGLDVGGSYALPSGTTLKLMLNGGKGIDRYIFGPYVGDAYVANDGNVTAIKRWSAVATVTQKFSQTVSANLIFGTTGVGGFSDQAAAINAACNFIGTKKGLGCVAKKYSDLHANILYTPVKELLFGLEYRYDRVEYRDGARAGVNALQFSAEYSF